MYLAEFPTPEHPTHMIHHVYRLLLKKQIRLPDQTPMMELTKWGGYKYKNIARQTEHKSLAYFAYNRRAQI